MSGMAEILIHRGYKVTGSDGSLGETTKRLEDIGATVYEGHDPKNIEGADVVVYTSAVKADENEETKAAIEQRIPTIKRAEMLAELMKMKYGIGVAGTHGKTTTTTMVGLVTRAGNYDPTIIVGVKSIVLIKRTPWLVKAMLLWLKPTNSTEHSFASLLPLRLSLTSKQNTWISMMTLKM